MVVYFKVFVFDGLLFNGVKGECKGWEKEILVEMVLDGLKCSGNLCYAEQGLLIDSVMDMSLKQSEKVVNNSQRKGKQNEYNHG